MLIRAILLMAALPAMAAAVQLDAREALRIGRTQDDALYAAFSSGYALAPSGPVSSAEIITEFRRAVMIVREHAQRGEFGFTERDLNAAMKPHEGHVSFVVQVQLHPLNIYQGVPLYEMYVSTGSNTPPLASPATARQPVYALGGPGSALIGLRLEGTFPRAPIAAAAAPELVVTDQHADVIWRARLDLSRYR
jgi:hypothetical protein